MQFSKEQDIKGIDLFLFSMHINEYLCVIFVKMLNT
jgi:hypothetical protein